ncbi:signal peptidase II [Novosphingobium sp. PS1R-30]|uniref:Lipoprotein signal peptidase n=1 Tax=Novosphingobium anseongense TaxID=3133436 RepID=A0ABU8RW57_9SPHN
MSAPLPNVTKRRAIALIVAALVFGVDQWVKMLMLGEFALPDVGQIYVLPFFNLTWTENYGVSLGMLTAQSVEMRYLLVALTSLISLVVLVWMMREKAWPELLGLAFVLGGAIGNIRDRFTRGYVIDYADFHIDGFRPFLIFNIADAAITIGVLIILARSLFSREKPKPETEQAAPES